MCIRDRSCAAYNGIIFSLKIAADFFTRWQIHTICCRPRQTFLSHAAVIFPPQMTAEKYWILSAGQRDRLKTEFRLDCLFSYCSYSKMTSGTCLYFFTINVRSILLRKWVEVVFIQYPLIKYTCCSNYLNINNWDSCFCCVLMSKRSMARRILNFSIPLRQSSSKLTVFL